MEAAITNRTITVSRTYKHSDGTSETVTELHCKKITNEKQENGKKIWKERKN